jgi:hypothetical protein
MSDIGLFSGPFSTAFVLLILGAPACRSARLPAR